MTIMTKYRSSFILNSNSICSELIYLLEDKNDDFAILSRNLHSFIHERVDSLFVLVQNGCLWDADVILRSIAEASVKLVFVSNFSTVNDRNSKALEFWNDLGEINRLKQSKQARQLLSNTEIENTLIDDMIMSEDEERELGKKWTKSVRQRTEQP